MDPFPPSHGPPRHRPIEIVGRYKSSFRGKNSYCRPNHAHKKTRMEHIIVKWDLPDGGTFTSEDDDHLMIAAKVPFKKTTFRKTRYPRSVKDESTKSLSSFTSNTGKSNDENDGIKYFSTSSIKSFSLTILEESENDGGDDKFSTNSSDHKAFKISSSIEATMENTNFSSRNIDIRSSKQVSRARGKQDSCPWMSVIDPYRHVENLKYPHPTDISERPESELVNDPCNIPREVIKFSGPSNQSVAVKQGSLLQPPTFQESSSYINGWNDFRASKKDGGIGNKRFNKKNWEQFRKEHHHSHQERANSTQTEASEKSENEEFFDFEKPKDIKCAKDNVQCFNSLPTDTLGGADKKCGYNKEPQDHRQHNTRTNNRNKNVREQVPQAHRIIKDVAYSKYYNNRGNYQANRGEFRKSYRGDRGQHSGHYGRSSHHGKRAMFMKEEPNHSTLDGLSSQMESLEVAEKVEGKLQMVNDPYKTITSHGICWSNLKGQQDLYIPRDLYEQEEIW